jgi:hypothetical protein
MNVSNSETVQPATRRSRDEEWYLRADWKPSAEEFQAYLVREVAMAKVNISRGDSYTTLHSSTTIALAQGELDRETGNES